MHPDYTLDIAGTCPRCGMALVRATPFDVRDYGLEFRDGAGAGRARDRRRRWHFNIRHPGTGEQVHVARAGTRKALSPLRHQPGHGRTSSTFTPSSSPTGRGPSTSRCRRPGTTQVLSDFLPSGGASQLISRPLVTAGYTGDLAGDSAHLVPDTSPIKIVDDITASVSFDPPTFVAGSTATSSFT